MPKSEKTIIEPINAKFDNVTKKIFSNLNAPKRIFKSTHEGILPLANMELNVAVLDNGTRIINQSAVFKAFGRTKRGRAKDDLRVLNRPAFLDAKNLQPFINKDLDTVLTTLTYKTKTGKEAVGYDASILPKICKVYLDAREKGVLLKQQEPLARASEILLISLANIGITALVDEATGYQYDRKHDALRILLSKYIEEGLQKWLKTFPDAFFIEIDKLYSNETTTSQKRPQYYGKFINKYVYAPIENGYIKNKLNELNITDKGKRKARFHQWLTDEGRTVLIHQIGRVQGLMEDCPNITRFKTKAEKRKQVSIAPYLFNEMNEIE